MRTFSLGCFALLLGLSSFAAKVQADGDATLPKPTPTVKIDLHTDWFNVKYDDVRENTVIKPKDDLGPGSPTRTNDDDNMKMGISATVPGKTFDPKNDVAVVISFNRMAGMMKKGDRDMLLGTQKQDEWAPFHGNQVLLSGDCKDVLVVLPSGKKIQVKADAISYKTSNSEGFMGEKYQWETVSIAGGLDLLNQLQDGAKVALCDITFTLVKDQISQVRSVQAIINGLAPKTSK